MQLLQKGMAFAARIGYLAKGCVYILVGIFALLAVGDIGRQPKGSSGALSSVAAQPLGRILMFFIALGLLGYALWCATEAIGSREGQKRSKNLNFKSLIRRGMYLFKAGFYGYLCLGSFELSLDTDNDDRLEGGSDSEMPENAIAIILSHPYGRGLVYLIGLGILGVGAYQFYLGSIGAFRKKLHLEETSALRRSLVIAIGQLGVMARGLVFIRVGTLIMDAAYHLNPELAATPGEALKELEYQLDSRVFLVLALGLTAYGLHMLILARYRQIKPRL